MAEVRRGIWARPSGWRAVWAGLGAAIWSGAAITCTEVVLTTYPHTTTSNWPGLLLSLSPLPLLVVLPLGLLGGGLWSILARAAALGPRWWVGRLLGLALVGGASIWALVERFPALPRTASGVAGGLLLLALATWGLAMVLGRPLILAEGRLRTWLRWVLSRGAAIWLLLALWGAWALLLRWEQTPLAGVGVLDRAPLSNVVADMLQANVDLDGDGYTALLGGGDCDDGDPRVHPGAPEQLANGVDEDCDGQDEGPRPVIQAARQALHLALEQTATPGSGVPLRREPAPVILITLDTVRPDFLGLEGATPSPSPVLDGFAQQAAHFTRAYAQGPLTKASVSSMMTGLYFSELDRSRDAWTRLRPENKTLAEVMRDHGYRSSAVTSHAYLAPRLGHGQGFEVFRDLARPNGYWYADQVTQRGLAEVDRLSREPQRPFFLWLHYIDPHHPYVVHESLPEQEATQAEAAGPQGRYRAELRWTDQQLGLLLEGLRQRGLEEKVHVVIHSDHGESFGEHGYHHHGQALYEEQVQALLLWRGPGVKARRLEAPVMLLDLFPTLSGLASGEAPPAPERPGRGVDLWPALQGQELPERPVFIELFSDNRRLHRKAIIQGEWKLIRSLLPRVSWELYHLGDDPLELENLYDERPQQAQPLRDALDAFLRDGIQARPPR